MDAKFLEPYDPSEAEDRIYTAWENAGYFNPDTCIQKGITEPDAKPFSIVLPPPNVTGTLHMGHAAMLAVEDILVRYHRMKGFRTLWIPGTDHAAIATQSKVEKIIQKEEKKSRHDLGREAFLQRVEQFAQESHDTIVHQLRKMGSSLDWSREAYTLDEERNFAVRTAFKNMYDLGLIYRGNRIVNWDPKGQTTISDDEIVYEERKAIMYTFKYSKDFPIAISTTRPETKVGDTAVAVHPDDERYKHYVGKEYDTVFCGIPIHIKIIADEAVEKEFGTGALGVTPAHSMVDFDMAGRHKLPVIQVINEYAKMTVDGDLHGLKTTDARAKIVEWLKSEDLLEKEEEITQNISTAERTGGIIEPLPKLQWFVAVNKPFTLEKNGQKTETTLKEIMKKSVESGAISIAPDRFEKIYYHWIDNLRDWCISRQIWFGHRIPVWYRSTNAHGKSDQEIYVGVDAPKGEGWKQDEDTLDTWFSSGLWTFSTLGWPEQTDDLKIYHPTSLLETGYDILFFWIARMILMSGALLGEVPFKNVYLHGLVRDEKGRKMSKSIGNIIDPLDMIEKYGADAARMSLIVGAAPGSDIKLSEQKVKGYKHFANKIWNITRFILTNIEDFDIESEPTHTPADVALIEELEALTRDITADIEHYRLYLAADKLYHFIWHRVADEILEQSKEILRDTAQENQAHRASRQHTLYVYLVTLLKMLHPFMPFVTEEIWSALPTQDAGMLMVSPWPHVVE